MYALARAGAAARGRGGGRVGDVGNVGVGNVGVGVGVVSGAGWSDGAACALGGAFQHLAEAAAAAAACPAALTAAARAASAAARAGSATRHPARNLALALALVGKVHESVLVTGRV
jgi:hypothetical protein